MAHLNREQLGELLSAYLDGELVASEKALVERTLQRDPEARQTFEELRRTVRAVQSLPRHSAPSSVAEAVRVQLERQELVGLPGESRSRTSRVWRATRWLSAAAMIALVFWGGWWALQSRPPAAGPLAKVTGHDRSKDDGVVDGARPPLAASRPQIAATFAEKQAAGADEALLFQHEFANESWRLHLSLADARERDEVAGRIVQSLREQQVADLARVAGARGGPSPNVPTTLFYEGRAGVNFDDSSQRQILVRASPEQLSALIGEVRPQTNDGDRLWLRDSSMTVGGLENAQARLRGMGPQAQSPGAPAADAATEAFAQEQKSEPELGLFGDLLESLKVKEAISTPRTAGETGGRDAASSTGNSVSGPEEKPTEADTATEKKSAEAGGLADTRSASSEKTQEEPKPSSLVHRRLLEAEERAKSRSAQEDAPARAGRIEADQRKAQGILGSPAARGDSTVAEPSPGLITLILELAVPSSDDKPTPPQSTAKTKREKKAN